MPLSRNRGGKGTGAAVTLRQHVRCYFFFAACFFLSGAWVRAEALTDLVCLGVTDLGLFMPFDAIDATLADVFSVLAIVNNPIRKFDC